MKQTPKVRPSFTDCRRRHIDVATAEENIIPHLVHITLLLPGVFAGYLIRLLFVRLSEEQNSPSAPIALALLEPSRTFNSAEPTNPTCTWFWNGYGPPIRTPSGFPLPSPFTCHPPLTEQHHISAKSHRGLLSMCCSVALKALLPGA